MPTFFQRGLKRIALLLLVYSFCRLLFLLWNWDLYSSVPATEWIWAFVHGLRFDMAAIVMTNAVVMLLWLLPARFYQGAWLSRLEILIFAAVNWIAIGSNVVDAEFVKFIGKRTSYDMLLIQQDLRQHGWSVISSYWYFAFALTIVVIFLAWLSPPMRGIKEPPTWWGKLGWRLGALVLLVLAVRGGFQFKPLHPMHAYFSTRQELGLLTLNTPFNVVKTRPRAEIQRQRFFTEDKTAIQHLLDMTSLTRPPLGLAKNFNVVVIIVESLASEYMAVANNYDYPAYTPFLDSLAKDAFYFKTNFANGRRSLEAVPAVFCGIPSIMQEPVITSDFSNNRFDCLPKILGRLGYQTHFLHGAHNGSMHFDTFSKIAGFETFVGLNEYPKDNPEDLDPAWGVLDEPMLQYAATTLDRADGPTMVGVFTLSSHHPYYIPEKYRGQFPKGTLEIHESIGYADHALKKFFETAARRPWFNNTIFIITGDHTQKIHHKEYQTHLGYYKVPLFIHVPGLKGQLKVNRDRITQHSDILPSVLDLLGIERQDRLLVGQSVFDLKMPGRSYNFDGHNYLYLDDQVFLRMNREGGVIELQKHLGKSELAPFTGPEGVKDSALLNLKAVVHYLNEGLVRNNLYGWRSSL